MNYDEDYESGRKEADGSEVREVVEEEVERDDGMEIESYE